MARRGPATDFSAWGNILPDSIRIDNRQPYGVIMFSNGTPYASEQTIAEYDRWWQRPVVAAEAKDKKTREVVLDTAKQLTMGDRNSQYGEPYDDFKKVSDALNAYGYSGPGGRQMMPRDVPFFQILVKLSRITNSPTKDDSWIDTAGYAACGAEVAGVEAAINE